MLWGGPRPRARSRQLGLGLLRSIAILDGIVDGRGIGVRVELWVGALLRLVGGVVLVRGGGVLWEDGLAGLVGRWWVTLVCRSTLTDAIVDASSERQTRMAVCRRHGGRIRCRRRQCWRAFARRRRQRCRRRGRAEGVGSKRTRSTKLIDDLSAMGRMGVDVVFRTGRATGSHAEFWGGLQL